MQVKTNRKGRPGKSGQPVLPAQILAVGREKQLAGIDQPEAFAVAVMRRRDPLLTLVLGTLASNRSRAAAERAVGANLDRVGIGDDHDRMRGARPRDPPPIGLRAAIGAAIYDDPLALMAQLERQWTCMRVVVETARRRFAGVDQNEALEGLQPVESSIG